MELKLETIFNLLRLDQNQFSSEPTIIESENSITIVIELKNEKERKCPYCKSHNVVVKDMRTSQINFSLFKNINKPVYISISKRRYKCKNCGKTYTQSNPLSEKKRKISTELEDSILELSKKMISFRDIARLTNTSVSTVIRVFDNKVKVGRLPLSIGLSIDEKCFHHDDESYVLVLSNSVSGNIIDILYSRKSQYVRYYFKKISSQEIKKVKYVTTDMYPAFKTLIKEIFPNAMHIIDHFHIKNLFIKTINEVRISCMKNYEKDTKEYRFFKKYRTTFTVNEFKENSKAIERLYKTYIDRDTGEVIDIKEQRDRLIHDNLPLLEIHDCYLDFCQYMNYGLDREDARAKLDFIINKLWDSSFDPIGAVALSLIDYKEEILNFYSVENKYHLSNGIAEGNNAKIMQIIRMASGFKTFKIFKKRVLRISQNKKE